MTEYQENDMVVARIDGTDVMDLSCGEDVTFYNEQILGKLEDFQSVEKKVKMTVDEKEEFDRLMHISVELFPCLSIITTYNNSYPLLYKRLFDGSALGNKEAQFEFSRAWDKPSRIEVVEPEHEFKIGDLVKVKDTGLKGVINIVCDSIVKMIDQEGFAHFPLKKDIEFIKSNAIDWGE